MYDKERQQYYYKKNKERIVERQKAYYQENKEKIAAKRKAYYEKTKKPNCNKKYKGIKVEKLIPEVTIFEFVCPSANQQTAREIRFGAYRACGCNTMCYVDDGKVELYVYKPEDNEPIIKYLEDFLEKNQ